MESAENQAQSIPENELGENSESSLSKTETLKLLNDSIDQLEQTIKGIKDNSATIPPRNSLKALLSTTKELADAAAINPVTSSVTIEEAEIIVKAAPEKTETTSKVSSEPIRSKPKAQQNASKIEQKRNLTWIVVGVTMAAIAIVTIFWLWLPQQRLATVSEPTISEVSSNPVEGDREPTAEPFIVPPKIVADNTAIDNSSTELESTNSIPEDFVTEAPEKTLIPLELDSPGRTKNIKMVAIEPELNFTPEQTLIATLETKVASLTEDYPALIESIRVDLPQNSLLVNVSDDWYQLSESDQNKLANRMLERSQEFSFNKLELKDNLGTLIARNPVIGDRIIILQNSKINE